MEPYTLDRKFLPQDTIDGFNSVIWTERYYGDSEVELVVPATSDMIQKLPPGTFLGLPESDEVMLLETFLIEDELLNLVSYWYEAGRNIVACRKQYVLCR